MERTKACNVLRRDTLPTPSRSRLACFQGYFYYFMDVGSAVLACTDPSVADHAPGPQYSWDTDTRMRCAGSH